MKVEVDVKVTEYDGTTTVEKKRDRQRDMGRFSAAFKSTAEHFGYVQDFARIYLSLYD